MQHKKQDWAHFCSLGIVELYGQYYRAIKVHHIDIVVSSLRNELTTSLVDGTFSEDDPEKRALEQALSSLSSTVTVEDLKNDIRIYMEVTISRTKCNAIASGPEIMVITDDHVFLKIFASNPTAENILLAQVQEVLGSGRDSRITRLYLP